VDGGVLAGRFLDRRRLAFLGRRRGRTRLRRYTFLRNNTMIVCTSNRADGYMLDLVNVAARKRRRAQNV